MNPATVDRLIRAHSTPRALTLDRIERYATGRQYDGMVPWLAPSEDVPMLERGPHVVDPIVSKAIASYVDILVGDGRFPRITSNPEEDGEILDEDLGLGEDDSATFDAWVRVAGKRVKLQLAASEAVATALSGGSAVSILSVERGKVTIKPLPARWSTPEYDDNGELLSVEVSYPYVKQVRQLTGKWEPEVWLYRRRIDRARDVVAKDVRAPEDGSVPTFSDDKVSEHAFGYVPIVWWALGHEKDRGSVDGHAIHENLTDEIDALCRACSQHNRAGLYAGDPLMVETGVDEDHNPSPGGRKAESMACYQSERNTPAARAHAQWLVGGPRGSGGAVRRKGPGVVWRYPATDSRVAMLTLSGDALSGIAGDRDDLRAQLEDALAYVNPDGSQGHGKGGINFARASGEFLRLVYRRQTARADVYRQQFVDGWLLPMVELILRTALHYSRLSELRIELPALQKIATILQRFESVSEDGRKAWTPPYLDVVWPPYFAATSEDNAADAKTVRDDFAAKLITRETAVTKIAAFYNIEDPVEYAEKLEEEAKSNLEALHKAMSSGGDEGADDGKTKPFSGGSAKPGDEAGAPGESAGAARG